MGRTTKAGLKTAGYAGPSGFVQMADGTVYATYDFPNCRRPAPVPTRKGMTAEQVDATWDAHLRHIGHEDG